MKWTRRRLRRNLPQMVTAGSLAIAAVATVGIAHVIQRPALTAPEREAYDACLSYILRTDRPYPAPGSARVSVFHSREWQDFNRLIHQLGYAGAIDVDALYETERDEYSRTYEAERGGGFEWYWVVWVGEYPDTVTCVYTTYDGSPWDRPTLMMRDGVVTQ